MINVHSYKDESKMGSIQHALKSHVTHWGCIACTVNVSFISLCNTELHLQHIQFIEQHPIEREIYCTAICSAIGETLTQILSCLNHFATMTFWLHVVRRYI